MIFFIFLMFFLPKLPLIRNFNFSLIFTFPRAWKQTNSMCPYQRQKNQSILHNVFQLTKWHQLQKHKASFNASQNTKWDQLKCSCKLDSSSGIWSCSGICCFTRWRHSSSCASWLLPHLIVTFACALAWSPEAALAPFFEFALVPISTTATCVPFPTSLPKVYFCLYGNPPSSAPKFYNKWKICYQSKQKQQILIYFMFVG